ncbi:MAG: hypothetical protein KAW12_14765 [Candidatus Aminicenantes bacterium]|nr:hypothetical protein [Candidatus Aminicenantes bacterium]
MKRLLILFVLVMMVLPIFSQEKITEKVKIDWWVLPLFAIDKGGNSVLDLKDEDIDLRVNGRKVTGFTFYKRAFSVEAGAKPAAEASPVSKRKLVFLLFDIAYTTNTNFERSKEIARDLVRKAEKNTLFTILMIDPLTGPVYVGGPLSDKRLVLKLLDNDLKWDPLTKSIKIVMYLAGATQVGGRGSGGKGSGGRGGRLSPEDIAILGEQRSSAFRKANMNYYMAFQTLYHALNSIKDNKFIYLFSEGISFYARQVLTKAKEEYWFFVKKTAGYLGRCGAVLFIINPAGAVLNYRSLQSGEDSLRFLARESGGKYMEGETKTISAQIQEMNCAYYEIAFPDDESFGDKTRKITISSQRKGVKVHTLRSLEKSKPYNEMKDIEKEVLVLNLLNPSPIFNSPLKTRPLKVSKKSGKDGVPRYKIDLPRDFKEKSIEIFKIWTHNTSHEADVKKENFVTGKRALEITMPAKKDMEARIVLVSERINTALVQGLFDAKARKEAILSGAAEEFVKKVKQMKPQHMEALAKLRDGAGGYCTKLGEAVFHCICKETVSEVLDDIRVQKQLGESKLDEITRTYRAGFSARDNRRIVRRKLTNKYVNDYQLVNRKGRLVEQRKLIKGKIKKVGGKEGVLKLDAFISRKVSLSPLTFFGPGSQDRFHYCFVKYEKLKGVKTALIECFPKDPKKAKTIFGKLWVDLADHSIMRITVNPVSIGGYTELLKRAKYYNSKLILTCRIDFYKKRNGIRFPTKVLVREVYSGGIELRKVVKKTVWERSKTTYTFNDYRFFDVGVQPGEEGVVK